MSLQEYLEEHWSGSHEYEEGGATFKIVQAFDFISTANNGRLYSMEYVLTEIAAITDTKTDEARALMWALLRTINIIDESDVDLFTKKKSK